MAVSPLVAVLVMVLANGVFASARAGSPVTDWPKKIQSFENTDCVANDSCALKRFEIEVNDYRVRFNDGDSFGTRMAASYETDSVSSLEDFVIVQFITGCQFHSKLVNNEFQNKRDILRYYFGKLVTFKHPTWAVDSDDQDPSYWSYAEQGLSRHHIYAWNDEPNSTIEKGRHRYGKTKPPFAKLYVTDFPGAAAYMWGEASNISLKFRTCIYKTADVPLATDSSGNGLGPAVHCLEWASSFIYDHLNKTYRQSEQIDPFCQE